MALYDVSVTLRPEVPTWEGEPGLCLDGADGAPTRVVLRQP